MMKKKTQKEAQRISPNQLNPEKYRIIDNKLFSVMKYDFNKAYYSKKVDDYYFNVRENQENLRLYTKDIIKYFEGLENQNLKI